jgi:hypothetical protein
MTKLQRIVEAYGGDEDILKVDDFDDCVVGITATTPRRLIYDYDKMIYTLTSEISRIDAIEHLEYNVLGAYVGEHTPIYLTGLDE